MPFNLHSVLKLYTNTLCVQINKYKCVYCYVQQFFSAGNFV